MSAPLRLRLDGSALIANWRWLQKASGPAVCGAAIKANGYGLGAEGVVRRLAGAGCRDFFVATWDEARPMSLEVGDANLSVLHGLRAADMALALRLPARPVISSPEQAARWRGTGRPCDAMIDTGINRLGVSPADVAQGALDGLSIVNLMSHLACGDEDSPMNADQRQTFAAIASHVPAERRSLANSAGICLGADYHFDLTRPGLALYGGAPRAEAIGHIAQVAWPEAEILQVRTVKAGGSVGYGATYTASADRRIAIVNLGYADGYLRGFSGTGSAEQGQVRLVGRVSMDLTAFDVTDRPDLNEGDWLRFDFTLPLAAEQSGLSQYELLTTLGRRYERIWI